MVETILASGQITEAANEIISWKEIVFVHARLLSLTFMALFWETVISFQYLPVMPPDLMN